MKIFSYKLDSGQSSIGLETSGGRYNFSKMWSIFKDIKSSGKGPEFQFLQLMLEFGYFQLETFQTVFHEVKDFRSLKGLQLTGPLNFEEPIGRPQKIIAMMKNYVKHAQEFNSSAPVEPIFFLKPISAQVAHGKPIIIPAAVGRVDHEVELAVVIGKIGRNIPESAAMDHVAGYTIANDVTARRLQKDDRELGYPWTRCKGFDTFCPIGPYLVPKEVIPDPHNLKIELSVNGEVRQSANTGDMIFKIDYLISQISRYMTLQPGDIILTGTPEGVGPIVPGDTVEATVEGLGILFNRVTD